MAFSVTAVPTAFSLAAAGAAQDVVLTYQGVTAEASGTATVNVAVGAESVTVALDVTLEEPDPTIVEIITPAGVTAEVLSNDDAQAVIRFTRT